MRRLELPHVFLHFFEIAMHRDLEYELIRWKNAKKHLPLEASR